ncbi:MAG: hypothetical protein RI885_1556 [Actinomycetota bacterium]
MWRWFDAVVLDDVSGGSVTVWEPAHGRVTARVHDLFITQPPGNRAYASLGLRGDDWWVSGPVVANPIDAAVELSDVQGLYRENGLWPKVFPETD